MSEQGAARAGGPHASETSPLLGASTRDPHPDQPEGAPASPQEAESGEVRLAEVDGRFRKALVLLTGASLFFSIVSCGHIVAIKILSISAVGPPAFRSAYSFDESTSILLAVSIICFLFSLPNMIFLRHNSRPFLPNWMLFIADGLLAAFGVITSMDGLGNLLAYPQFSCSTYYEDRPSVLDRCRDYARKVTIVAYVACAVAFVLGLVHLALFVMRCIEGHRSRYVRRRGWSFPWKFPHGEFTIALSFKFVREPERSGQQANEPTTS